MQANTIVVFSHLRWDFVYQRPQHLLSRLAQKHRILFIEEPIHSDAPEAAKGFWEKSDPEPNVRVCRPRTNRASHGFSEEQIEAMKPMVESLLREEGLSDRQYVTWCYTAMACDLARATRPAAIAFDVMDELSAFKGAPPKILQNERCLLGLADVVFTGGPSLFRAKKDKHHSVHCFPSSVDRKHFATARAEGPAEDAEVQRDIPHPRLGFYGVIDERMDLDLIDAMAKAHPEWQIIMVGPVVKIDPASLPRHPNIHYTGQANYQQLPRFLTGWDVCLMPFAMNESTKFISPTKVLEYMAAEKPIVSTPIRDVEEPYGDICYIGHTTDEFIKHCEEALASTAEERERRVEKMRGVLARTSWDATAEAIDKLLTQAVELRESLDVAGPVAADVAAELRVPVAVIGAGPTGLSAAFHLGKDALLIDQNDRVGGWCRSIEDRGFTFDYAGHIMFSNEPYVHDMYKMLLGDNVHWQNREAWIYSKNVYTRYPFQGALYGLPPQTISDCIVGAIEARFGSIKTKADDHARTLHGNGNGSLTATAPGQTNGHNGASGSHSNGHSNRSNGHTNGIAKDGKTCPTNGKGRLSDCCGDGIMESEVKLVDWRNAHLADHRGIGQQLVSDGGEPKNFEEFIYKVWGWGIAKHFAIPYNRKIWAVDLKEMETSWLGGRVPLPDLEEMIKGALEPVPAPMGPNARFGYPLKGGFQAMMSGFLPYIKDRLMLNTRVVAVSPTKKSLKLSNGKTVRYQQLISTMPLPVLIRQMGDEVPEHVRQAAAGLRHTSVRCVNIGIGPRADGSKVSDKHWIYYPEDTVFHRIFVQGNASPFCNPDGGKGGFGFTCEITYSPSKPLPCDGEELIKLCIADARRCGFIREDDTVICSNAVDMPYAYVVYDHSRPKNIAILKDFLAQHDIVLVGRYSEWEYYNSDHAFLAGKRGAETVRTIQAKRAERLHQLSRMRESAGRDADESGWMSASSQSETSSVRDQAKERA